MNIERRRKRGNHEYSRTLSPISNCFEFEVILFAISAMALQKARRQALQGWQHRQFLRCCKLVCSFVSIIKYRTEVTLASGVNSVASNKENFNCNEHSKHNSDCVFRNIGPTWLLLFVLSAGS